MRVLVHHIKMRVLVPHHIKMRVLVLTSHQDEGIGTSHQDEVLVPHHTKMRVLVLKSHQDVVGIATHITSI